MTSISRSDLSTTCRNTHDLLIGNSPLVVVVEERLLSRTTVLSTAARMPVRPVSLRTLVAGWASLISSHTGEEDGPKTCLTDTIVRCLIDFTTVTSDMTSCCPNMGQWKVPELRERAEGPVLCSGHVGAVLGGRHGNNLRGHPCVSAPLLLHPSCPSTGTSPPLPAIVLANGESVLVACVGAVDVASRELHKDIRELCPAMCAGVATLLNVFPLNRGRKLRKRIARDLFPSRRRVPPNALFLSRFNRLVLPVSDIPTQVPPLTPGTNKKMTEALKASFASWEKEQLRLNIVKGGPGSFPGEAAPGFSHVGIVPYDAAGLRVFSGISFTPQPCIPALLHTHLATSSSTLNTSMLRAVQISPLSNYAQTAQPRKGFVTHSDKSSPITRPSGAHALIGRVCEVRMLYKYNVDVVTWTGTCLQMSLPLPPQRCPPHAACGVLVAYIEWQGWQHKRNLFSHLSETLLVFVTPPSEHGDEWSDQSSTTTRSGFDSRGVAPDIRMWLTWWTLPLVGRVSRGTPVSPAVTFRRCSILTLHHPILPTVKIMLLDAHKTSSLTQSHSLALSRLLAHPNVVRCPFGVILYTWFKLSLHKVEEYPLFVGPTGRLVSETDWYLMYLRLLANGWWKFSTPGDQVATAVRCASLVFIVAEFKAL
ncbi:hypothetical protein PR048_003050 [Dryococelus australis]|uniref:Uncharacterized protein n=1 Tax=Dryococelus australis TaxID=614101 RepID=A0ABQ9INF0_9NEOP|nr:hypothetical protein PR048_003050 [Dryococelus australis]